MFSFVLLKAKFNSHKMTFGERLLHNYVATAMMLDNSRWFNLVPGTPEE